MRLRKRIKQLEDRLEAYEEWLKKLKRIIEFSKDGEVTYRLRSEFYHGTFIDIYDNKEEYSVRLEELSDGRYIPKSRCKFEVRNRLAYLTISDPLLSATCSDHFIIDYRSGKYVHEVIDNEDIPKKEGGSEDD